MLTLLLILITSILLYIMLYAYATKVDDYNDL